MDHSSFVIFSWICDRRHCHSHSILSEEERAISLRVTKEANASVEICTTHEQEQFLPHLVLRSPSASTLKVDRDYRRYEQALGEMQIEEDEMATTFVKKVPVI